MDMKKVMIKNIKQEILNKFYSNNMNNKKKIIEGVMYDY